MGVRDDAFKVPVWYTDGKLILHKGIRILGPPGNHVGSEQGEDYTAKHLPWGQLENTDSNVKTRK